MFKLAKDTAVSTSGPIDRRSLQRAENIAAALNEH